MSEIDVKVFMQAKSYVLPISSAICFPNYLKQDISNLPLDYYYISFKE